MPAPLAAAIPSTYRVQDAFITSSKVFQSHFHESTGNWNSSRCQLTPSLHTTAAQRLPVLASVPPLAACFSHGCATKLAPPRTGSNMRSMPASSYARNPAREALDSLLEPPPFPLRLWLAFFFFFFCARSDSSCAPSLSPSANLGFGLKSRHYGGPGIRNLLRKNQPLLSTPLSSPGSLATDGQRTYQSRSLFGPGATPSFSLLACASAPRPQEGPLCAHASR